MAQRKLWSGVIIAVLATPSALGQTTPPPSRPAQPPVLQPGQSAGVKTAQQGVSPVLALVGTGAIIALVVVTTTGSGSAGQPNSQSVPTTAP